MLGGVQAVTWTDVKVMGLTVFVAGRRRVVLLIAELPAGVSVGRALHDRRRRGPARRVRLQFRLTETYTFWSGIIGGLFLMLSYFGCDQSQVQRYLTADRSTRRVVAADERLLEDPAAGAGLLVGVLTSSCSSSFNGRPLLFNPVPSAAVEASAQAPQYAALEREFRARLDARRSRSGRRLRARSQDAGACRRAADDAAAR